MRIFALLICGSALFAQDKPVPDLATLMKEVTAHQREMETIRENYTCHQIAQTDEFDSKGEIKTSRTQEREVFFVNRHRIARIVKKQGEELTPAEQKAEQNRVTKLVERALKAPPPPGQNVNISISQILAVSKISNPRRVSLNDRDTLVFDFIGDPEASAHGLDQDAGKKMSGTLWIDEADHQVARLEVEFYENFAIGGGLLVSIQKGSKLEFEQTLVGEGLWMPSASEQHLTARALLVVGIRQDVHIREFDFRKFNIDSLQEIKPPAVDETPRP